MRIIAPTWSDEFILPDWSYSVSDIQGYIEYIIKNPPIIFFIFTSIGIRID